MFRVVAPPPPGVILKIKKIYREIKKKDVIVLLEACTIFHSPIINKHAIDQPVNSIRFDGHVFVAKYI